MLIILRRPKTSLNREQLLHDVTKTISQDIELDIVLDSLVEKVSTAINANGGLVLFYDQEMQSVSLLKITIICRVQRLTRTWQKGSTLAEDAIKNSRSVIESHQNEFRIW